MTQQHNMYICAALAAFGILFHFVLKLGELEARGQITTPWAYWREHPYTSLTVIMATYLTLTLQASLGELTYFSAGLTGVACNSLADKLRARGQTLADKVETMADKGVPK